MGVARADRLGHNRGRVDAGAGVFFASGAGRFLEKIEDAEAFKADRGVKKASDVQPHRVAWPRLRGVRHSNHHSPASARGYRHHPRALSAKKANSSKRVKHFLGHAFRWPSALYLAGIYPDLRSSRVGFHT
jgi:hypothetical protein